MRKDENYVPDVASGLASAIKSDNFGAPAKRASTEAFKLSTPLVFFSAVVSTCVCHLFEVRPPLVRVIGRVRGALFVPRLTCTGALRPPEILDADEDSIAENRRSGRERCRNLPVVWREAKCSAYWAKLNLASSDQKLRYADRRVLLRTFQKVY